MILVLLGQSVSCMAEHAGLAPCAVHVEENHDAGGADQDGQSTPSNCCQTHSHSAVVALDPAGIPRDDLLVGLAPGSSDAVPDGPVHEIDYPPQLS